MRILATAALVLAFLPGVAAWDAPSPNAFALGVLRRDGLLLPFAAFDGHRWKAPWPGPVEMGSRGEQPTLPIAVSDIPAKWLGGIEPGAPWTAWLPDGTSQALTLDKPIEARVFCQADLTIATDYRGGPFDVQAPTVPKDALAVTGGVTIEPITRVSTLSPDGTAMVGTIAEEFNKQEDEADRRFTDWRDPFTPAQRRTYPIEIEAFYRTPEPAPPAARFRTSYVEAVRKFPSGPGDRGCGLITFVSGWVIERDGKPPVIDLGARITYCDRAGVSFMQPLGLLHAGNDAFWVSQSSSWTDEFYTVARLRSDGVRPVVAAPGGACPQRRF